MPVIRGIGWALAWFFGLGGFFQVAAYLTGGEAPPIGAVIGFALGVLLTVILSKTAKAQDAEESTARTPTKPTDWQLPDDWGQALASRGLTLSEIHQIVEGAYRASPGNVLPGPHDVFRAFALTPRQDVKVVIVGQDPYADRRKACGLAFAVPRGVEVPHSLGRIYSKMESEFVPGSYQPPSHGDLSAWGRHGILLLNSALTVIEGKSGSQVARWSRFTRTVLEVINEGPSPVVFMLWGDDANALGDSIPLNEERHRVIRSTHPRREEPSQYPRFADTTPFVDANYFLSTRNRGFVNWSLD